MNLFEQITAKLNETAALLDRTAGQLTDLLDQLETLQDEAKESDKVISLDEKRGLKK